MNGQAALAVLRAERHVSISAITCYLTCPRQHEHRYILRTPPSHCAGALAFGTAIHAALAIFYRRAMEGQVEPTAEELETVFAEAWHRELEGTIPVLFDNGETEDSALDKGLALVQVFHAQARRHHKVVAVEEPFSVEIAHPTTGEVFPERLVGVLDAVVQDVDGSYQILEHKTAARRWTEARLTHDLQLSAYTLAAPLIGLGPAALTVQLFVKTKSPTLELLHPARTDHDRLDLMHVITGVLAAVEAGAFFPRRDWQCKSCPYSGPCIAG